MKHTRILALSLTALALLSSCSKTITRAEAETLLSSFIAVTEDSSYVRPTCWTCTTTYDKDDLDGAVSWSYDATNLYFHMKKSLTETDSESSKASSAELYLYMKDDIFVYYDTYNGVRKETSADAEAAFHAKVAEYYDVEATLDDCFSSTPSMALLRLQGFDADASSLLAESYKSEGDTSLEMSNKMTLGSHTVRENLNFEKSRFFQRVLTEDGDKTTEIYAWDMISLNYPASK